MTSRLENVTPHHAKKFCPPFDFSAQTFHQQAQTMGHILFPPPHGYRYKKNPISERFRVDIIG